MKQFGSTKLWVQFSLAFSGVVLLAAVALITIGFLLRPDPPANARVPTEAEVASFRPRIQQVVAQSLITLVITGSALGIGAGIWMSRRMTAPLEALAEGTDVVGGGNLAYRVTPKGSEEMVALAESFNQMATRLEGSEQLRRNLLADVAHELRTPLTVLQGNLRAILDDVYALDKGEVARLYDQTRHIHRMVNDLHELAQAEARQLPLDCQPVDLVELAAHTTSIFEPVAEAEAITLCVDLPPSPIMVRIDRARITQVLQNLLNNSLRHTPLDGTIQLRVASNEDASIVITDSGEGIAPEHLAHLFDRFYRTDQARDRDSGGAGLGLAIVRALVEAHGGTVTAQSPGIGHGSTFTIKLPLMD